MSYVERFGLAVLLKPFVAIVLFLSARLIAMGIYRVLPDGRVRRALFRPIGRSQ